jgi:thioredoxin 1
MSQANALGHVTTDAFDREVLESQVPVVVDLFATWCGPCRMLTPVLERLAAAYDGRVKFVKVDVDEEPELASRFDVTGVPTLLIFKGGTLVDQVVGFVPAPALQARLDRLAAGAGAPEAAPRIHRG